MKEPVIFVHGFLGWGKDENFIDYWSTDMIEKNFSDKNVYIASVGAISSNWDRACELYAQIKGGTVDYGKYHSVKNGHSRYGKTYEGFFPEWDTTTPLVMIGHSMGGQTIRQLEKLLQVGDKNEVGDDTSPLFLGLGRMIKTIITISTPHLGTPIFDILGDKLTDKIKDSVINVGMNITKNEDIKKIYNMDIEHFNLLQLEGETNESYKNRIKKHRIWETDYKDISSWDLSPRGSKEFNDSTKNVYPNVYYLAIATSRTYDIFGISFPSFRMFTGFLFTSLLLGINRYGSNDGLVPKISSRGPCDGVLLGSEEVKPEKWYYKDVRLDHLQVLGIMGEKDRVDNVFKSISEFINKQTST